LDDPDYFQISAQETTVMAPFFLCGVALVALFAVTVTAAPAADEITSLPGWSPKPLPSRHFSGCVQTVVVIFIR
jgi:hypothetical protein